MPAHCGRRPLLVIDDNEEKVAALKAQGVEAVAVNAAMGLEMARLPSARAVIVAVRIASKQVRSFGAGACRQRVSPHRRPAQSDEEAEYSKAMARPTSCRVLAKSQMRCLRPSRSEGH